MELKNAVVLITGANRGLGLEFARQVLARGAKRVYAGARDAGSINLEGVAAVQLDVTRPEDIAAAALSLGDVTLIINNAGIARPGGLIAGDAATLLRDHLETNVLGVLNVSQAFAPALASNGGGAILNVLSALSWMSTPMLASYGASKAAAWGVTNGLRHELRGQGTRIIGLHAGFIDTDLTRGLDVPKIGPAEVVRLALDAIEADAEEVLVDAASRQVHENLSHSIYLNDPMAA